MSGIDGTRISVASAFGICFKMSSIFSMVSQFVESVASSELLNCNSLANSVGLFPGIKGADLGYSKL